MCHGFLHHTLFNCSSDNRRIISVLWLSLTPFTIVWRLPKVIIYIYTPLKKVRVLVLSLSALNLQSAFSSLLCSYRVELKYNQIRVDGVYLFLMPIQRC